MYWYTHAYVIIVYVKLKIDMFKAENLMHNYKVRELKEWKVMGIVVWIGREVREQYIYIFFF